MRAPDIKQIFRNLWELNAAETSFYALARTIHPDLLWSEFDRCWQWRTVLHADFDAAVVEFTQCLFGNA
jgi:hypothetical protein